MIMKRFIPVFTLLSLLVFVLLSPVAVFGAQSVIQSSAPVADRQRNTVCLKTTWCDSSTDTTGLCSKATSSDIPSSSHRMHVATDSSLKGKDFFLMECVSIQNGGEACYPIPTTNEGKIENASWGENKVNFINTWRKACEAQFSNINNTNCNDTVDGSAQAEFIKQAQKGNDDSGGYLFEGLFAKNGSSLIRVDTLPETGIPANGYEWASYTPKVRTRYLIGISFSDPPVASTTSTDDNSNKIDQLGFLTVPDNCKAVSGWDPYGIAFYSGAGTGYLEPISDAQIRLYQKTTSDVFEPYVINSGTDFFANPQNLSLTNGGFSFTVPPNFYRLVVSKLGTFPDVIPPLVGVGGFATDLTAATKFPTGQVKVKIADEMGIENTYTLYKNIAKSSNTDYWPAFEEKAGQLLEVNIPIDSDSIVPPAATYTYQQVINPVSGLETYNGYTNKPLAKVVLRARQYTDTEGLNPVTKSRWVRADQDGKFKMVVDPKKDYVLGEVFAGFEIDRPNLRNAVITTSIIDKAYKLIASISERAIHLLDLATPVAYAQTQSKLPPLRLGYVEGYAYGADGAVLKNTTVIIMDTMLSLQYSSVKTDETGYFVIRPHDLPPRGYSLVFMQSEAPYKTIGTATLEQFVKANLPYIQQNKINLAVPTLSQSANTFTQAHPELFTSVKINPGVTGQPSVSGVPSGTVISGTQINPSGSQPVNPNPTIQQVTQEPVGPEMKPFSPALLIYVALLLFLVVGASLLIVYYMKRRQEPHLYE